MNQHADHKFRYHLLLVFIAALLVALLAGAAGSLAYLKAAAAPVRNSFTGAICYTLRYDGNAAGENISVPGEQKSYAVGSFTISSTEPARSGYRFTGWNTASDGSGAAAAPGGDYTATELETTLYAQWEPESYILIYDANGGAGGPVRRESDTDSTFTIESLADLGVSHSSPGKVFLGWADSDQSGATPVYGYGGLDHEDNQTLAAEVTVSDTNRVKIIYAVWATEYKLTLDANGGTGPVPAFASVISAEDHCDFTLPAREVGQVPTRESYTFELWGDKPSRVDPFTHLPVTLKTCNYGETVRLEEAEPQVTYYAFYKPNTPNVLSFDPNVPAGVRYSNIPVSISATTTESVWSLTLPDNVPTADNRTFRGWALAPDAEEPDYRPGDEFSMNLDESYVGTLYALWQAPHRFAVTFHLNADNLPDAEKASFGSVLSSSDGALTKYTDYAVFTTKEYDANTKNVTIAKGRTRVDVQRPGYRFVGWSTDPDFECTGTPDFVSAGLYTYIQEPMTLTCPENEGSCNGGVHDSLHLYAVWMPRHIMRIEFVGCATEYVGTAGTGYYTHPELGITQGFKGSEVRWTVPGTTTSFWATAFYSPSLDYTVKSFTVPAGNVGAMPLTRPGYTFLGWSEDPYATAPDLLDPDHPELGYKYALDANGKFVNDITFTDPDPDCPGGYEAGGYSYGNDQKLTTHTTLRLFGVWGTQHRLAVKLHAAPSVGAGSSRLDLGGKNGGSTSDRVVTTPDLPVSETSYTISAGADFSASVYGFGREEGGYKFLGWSTTPGASAPDPEWTLGGENSLLDESGKLKTDYAINLADHDPSCAGGYADSWDGNAYWQNTIYHTALELYAVWEPLHSMELLLNNNGGGNISVERAWLSGARGSQSDALGTHLESADLPLSTKEFVIPGGTVKATATRTGYTFLGWSEDPDATTPDLLDPDHPELGYKYALDENGRFVNAITLTDPDPSCPGGKDPVTKYRTRHTALTLYAVWEKQHAFRINYHYDGVTTSKKAFDQLDGGRWYAYSYQHTVQTPFFKAGESWRIPAGTSAYVAGAGKMLWGWSEDPTAATPDLKWALDENGCFAGDVLLTEPDPNCQGGNVIHDVDLYAVWKDAHTYSICFEMGEADRIFNNNAGYTIAQIYKGEQLLTTEHSYTFPAKTIPFYAEKANYTFLGWSSNPDAEAPDYTVAYSKIAQDIVVTDPTHSACAAGSDHTLLTLYPVFEVTYKLTYHANTGGTNAPPEQLFNDKKPFDGSHTYAIYDDVANGNPPTYRKFAFVGWSRDRTASYATYGHTNSFNTEIQRVTQSLQPTITLTPGDHNVTLYAVWWYQYKLTYDANGGAGAPGVGYGYASNNTFGFDISETAPVRNGFTFLGWADSPGAASPQYQAGDKLMLTGATSGNNAGSVEKTIYAVWQQN